MSYPQYRFHKGKGVENPSNGHIDTIYLKQYNPMIFRTLTKAQYGKMFLGLPTVLIPFSTTGSAGIKMAKTQRSIDNPLSTTKNSYNVEWRSPKLDSVYRLEG